MVVQIGRIQAGGQTNTSDALWLAYIELQKAHLRDLAADGHDWRMNSIVLLTDGLPQAVSVWPNNPTENVTTPGSTANNVLKPASPCTNNPATTTTFTPMKGFIAVSRNGSNNFTGNPPLGLYQEGSTNSGHTSVYMVQHGQIEEDLNPATNVNCSYMQFQPGAMTATHNDFRIIPSIDLWGNSMRGNIYQTASYSLDRNGTPQTNPLPTALAIDATQVGDGRQWAIAFWNAADSAAQNIRMDSNRINRVGDTQDMRVTIHVIGYAGNANLDPGLCKRMANHLGVVDATQPIGKYVEAKNQTELQNGFSTIFQTILRLAK
jgi:hypothetical protein